MQQITLKNLNVREKLGLLDKGAPVTTANPKEIDIPRGTQQDQLRQGGTISVQHLSAEELLVVSAINLNRIFAVNFKMLPSFCSFPFFFCQQKLSYLIC